MKNMTHKGNNKNNKKYLKTKIPCMFFWMRATMSTLVLGKKARSAEVEIKLKLLRSLRSAASSIMRLQFHSATRIKNGHQLFKLAILNFKFIIKKEIQISDMVSLFIKRMISNSKSYKFEFILIFCSCFFLFFGK